MGPRILTDAGAFMAPDGSIDYDLLGIYDDLDEFLDNENCDCPGTCRCEEEG